MSIMLSLITIDNGVHFMERNHWGMIAWWGEGRSSANGILIMDLKGFRNSRYQI